jgi:hypothetical protein
MINAFAINEDLGFALYGGVVQVTAWVDSLFPAPIVLIVEQRVDQLCVRGNVSRETTPRYSGREIIVRGAKHIC